MAQASRGGRDTAANQRNHEGRPTSRAYEGGNGDEESEDRDAKRSSACPFFRVGHGWLVTRLDLNRLQQRLIRLLHRWRTFVNRFKDFRLLRLAVNESISLFLGVNKCSIHGDFKVASDAFIFFGDDMNLVAELILKNLRCRLIFFLKASATTPLYGDVNDAWHR